MLYVSSIYYIPLVGLDHLSKAKIPKTETYLATEREHNAALIKRVKVIEYYDIGVSNITRRSSAKRARSTTGDFVSQKV